MAVVCKWMAHATSDEFPLSTRLTMRHLGTVALILCALSGYCHHVESTTSSSSSSSGHAPSDPTVAYSNSSDHTTANDQMAAPTYDAAGDEIDGDEDEASHFRSATSRGKRQRTRRRSAPSASLMEDEEDDDVSSEVDDSSRPWLRSSVSKVIVYVKRRRPMGDDDSEGGGDPNAEAGSATSSNLTVDTWRLRQRSDKSGSR